jgi:hypothetical protein
MPVSAALRCCTTGSFDWAPSSARHFQSWALDQAYLLAPRVDFSRAVLQSSLPALAVLRVPALAWCDLGTPERVAKSRQMLE